MEQKEEIQAYTKKNMLLVAYFQYILITEIYTFPLYSQHNNLPKKLISLQTPNQNEYPDTD